MKTAIKIAVGAVLFGAWLAALNLAPAQGGGQRVQFYSGVATGPGGITISVQAAPPGASVYLRAKVVGDCVPLYWPNNGTANFVGITENVVSIVPLSGAPYQGVLDIADFWDVTFATADPAYVYTHDGVLEQVKVVDPDGMAAGDLIFVGLGIATTSAGGSGTYGWIDDAQVYWEVEIR